MRLTYFFPAQVVKIDSDTEVSVPDLINNRELATEQLEKYFDPDVADAGVVGGSIRAVAHHGQVTIDVVYCLPTDTPSAIIEQLTKYTVAQLKDGIGEGGFELEIDGERFRILTNTSAHVRVEAVEDGQFVRPPSRIA